MHNPLSENYSPEIPDEDLIKKSVEGDKKSLEALIIRHQDWIYNIALRMLHSPEDAKDALEAMVLNKQVRLRYGGERVDRHGRALGQLFIEGAGESWVQGEMVGAGMARVYSFPDNRSCLGELMAEEGRARAMKLGIWSDPYYTVRRADRPEALVPLTGRYELIEGRVLLAEQAGSRVFLNFGRYWKEDFTAVIEGSAVRMFSDLGLDPARLDGALVRVRGWLDIHDGPRIEVTHPEQIEVLATR